MSGGPAVPTASELRERAAALNDEPVHKGTYLVQSLGGANYGCLPKDFSARYGIEQASEVEVFVDYDIGCVMMFPSEVFEDGV